VTQSKAGAIISEQEVTIEYVSFELGVVGIMVRAPNRINN